MIQGVFPRLHGQYREGGIIHAKFVVSGSGASSTFAAKSAVAGSSHVRLSLARTGVGVLRLTLTGGARQIALLGDPVAVNVANPTTAASYCHIKPRAALVESTGLMDFDVLTNAGARAEMPFAATDEVHFTLYVDK
jgi:hypothetical protein